MQIISKIVDYQSIEIMCETKIYLLRKCHLNKPINLFCRFPSGRLQFLNYVFASLVNFIIVTQMADTNASKANHILVIHRNYLKKFSIIVIDFLLSSVSMMRVL